MYANNGSHQHTSIVIVRQLLAEVQAGRQLFWHHTTAPPLILAEESFTHLTLPYCLPLLSLQCLQHYSFDPINHSSKSAAIGLCPYIYLIDRVNTKVLAVDSKCQDLNNLEELVDYKKTDSF